MEEQTAPKSQISRKELILVIILTFVLAGSIIGLTVCILLLKSNSIDVTITDTDRDNIERPSSNRITGQIFYSVEGKIYSFDLASNNVTTWTSEPKEYTSLDSLDSAVGLTVVDKNTVSFAKCHSIMNNYRCGVYALDLVSNSVDTVEEFSGEDMVLDIGFGGRDLYAYITESDKAWKFVVENKGEQTVKESIPTSLTGGRGGFIEDSRKIRFSPDKTKVFYIATSNPKDVTDFTVNIFGVNSAGYQTIENATQPDWISDTQIIFRRPEEGLFVYDINKKTVEKVFSNASSYYPSAYDGNVVYERYPENEIYLLNNELSSATPILSKAINPVFVSSRLFVYEELQGCKTEGCGSEAGFDLDRPKLAKIYDLVTKKQIYIPNLTFTWGIASVL